MKPFSPVQHNIARWVLMFITISARDCLRPCPCLCALCHCLCFCHCQPGECWSWLFASPLQDCLRKLDLALSACRRSFVRPVDVALDVRESGTAAQPVKPETFSDQWHVRVYSHARTLAIGLPPNGRFWSTFHNVSFTLVECSRHGMCYLLFAHPVYVASRYFQ